MLRRPSVVRPSSSTISKIFFSETAGPIVLILLIHHLQVGGKNNCVFCFDQIRALVTMATYASHRLIMEKSENCQFLLSCWRYSQGRSGPKIGPVRLWCRFMVTYIKHLSDVSALFSDRSPISDPRLGLVMTSSIWRPLSSKWMLTQSISSV